MGVLAFITTLSLVGGERERRVDGAAEELPVPPGFFSPRFHFGIQSRLSSDGWDHVSEGPSR